MRHRLREHCVDLHCPAENEAVPFPAGERNVQAGRRANQEKKDRKNGRWLSLSLLITLLFLPGVLPAADGALHIIRYQPVQSISGGMKMPSDVGLDRSGRIFILDGTADTVRVYSPKGEPLFTLGGEGVLHQPLGLDVSAAGDVLVADSGRHRLALFAAEEKTPRYIDVPAPADGKPSDPTDAHFGPDHSFIVVDNDNHRVLALDASGKIIWAQGVMGRNPNEFRFPFLLDIDRHGKIYVVEAINTRIQVLDQRGEYSNFVGEWGIEPGQFFRPKGVVISDRDEVFASDSYLGVIQIFNPDGGLVGVIGDEKGNVAKYKTPVGMAISGNRLYVVEMFSNRVLVLERQSE
jgi:hypothetical protein